MLLRAADHDLERAQRGIAYIDEIDKIARKSENPSLTRDVSGEGVQQGLLKMFEGSVCNVPLRGGRKHPQQDFVPFDTRDVLFICGGAFVGLEDAVARGRRRRAVGFGAAGEADEAGALDDVRPEDLIRFGLIPEFVGRLPTVVTLDDLDEHALMQILTGPEDALLRQYQRLFELDGATLRLTDGAVRAVAREARGLGSGARGLRTVLDRILTDLQYDVGSAGQGGEIVVDEAAVLAHARPRAAARRDAA
jgi:ATP-dependent Clp protease ATP-binding subunit ClpX